MRIDLKGFVYPHSRTGRDGFVLDRREPARSHDPWRAQGLDVDDEALAGGRGSARTATVFLTGRECPWRCVMCDLWRHTTPGDTPSGAIPAQLAWALAELARRGEAATQFKLYNASSFFDPRAVPPDDYDEAARLLADASRVIVESHPTLVGPPVDRLLDSLARASGTRPPPALEVAMGLETAHPAALAALNKGMTLDGFRMAAGSLGRRGVAVRAFLLIRPPFIPGDEQDGWLLHSIDEAFAAGASVVSLIPTRPGNGAMEALAAMGQFSAPGFAHAEQAFEAGLAHAAGRGRLFLDLWDLERLGHCLRCFDARRDRLRVMNSQQRVLPAVPCRYCTGAPA